MNQVVGPGARQVSVNALMLGTVFFLMLSKLAKDAGSAEGNIIGLLLGWFLT